LSEVSSPPAGRIAPAESVRSEVGDIPAIEGLRGVAVLWVMVFHYFVLRDGKFDDAFIELVKSWTPLEAFVRNGYLGVDLFFLITGFLLILPWYRHADAGLPPPDWRSFYARRARRIVPAYYVQLVFLFFVVLPLLHPRIWIQSTPFVTFNLGAHFTFLHYTSPLTSSSMTVNGALWTLAIEMQYYLLLPLVAPLFVRWPWRSLVAAFLIAAGWRWLPDATCFATNLSGFLAKCGVLILPAVVALLWYDAKMCRFLCSHSRMLHARMWYWAVNLILLALTGYVLIDSILAFRLMERWHSQAPEATVEAAP